MNEVMSCLLFASLSQVLCKQMWLRTFAVIQCPDPTIVYLPLSTFFSAMLQSITYMYMHILNPYMSLLEPTVANIVIGLQELVISR